MKFKHTGNQSIPVGETPHEKLFVFANEVLRQVELNRDQNKGIEAAIQSDEGQVIYNGLKPGV